MNSASVVENDDYLGNMRAARSKSAVIKTKLLSLKSEIGHSLIFVFEGGDDKVVYAQWVRRLQPMLTYEPFVCNNKEQVLRLYDALGRDLGDAGRNVFFFIDRDFDDLKGRDHRPVLFMTDRYAIENYLVSAQVLDDLLKNEFPCDGQIALRRAIIETFEAVFDEFLQQIKEFNFHIFVARRVGIEFRGNIPDSLAKVADVRLLEVHGTNYNSHDILPYMAAVDEDCAEGHRAEFDSLDQRQRYRGKFIYKFFVKWVSLLIADYKNDASHFFSDLDRARTVREADIVLSNIASKSEMPLGLDVFISRVFSAQVA